MIVFYSEELWILKELMLGVDKMERKEVTENKDETKVNWGKEMQINGVLVLSVYTHFTAVYIPLCHPLSCMYYVT